MHSSKETGVGADVSVANSTIRKASWRIIPLIGLGYLCSYLDRLNVSFAATQMNIDLGFSATVYGIGGGLFFLTYALLEIPSGMVMPRIGPRRWIARIMISWGAISAGMMFVQTPLQFYVMRLLLGAAEAGFWPTCMYVMSAWFPKAYRGRAISRFYCAGGITGIVGGVLSAWLLSLDGLGGLQGWQWLFLLEGLPTIVLGLVILRHLPDSPATASWLSENEKTWLIQELAAENARHGTSQHSNVLRVLREPLVLQIAAVACLTIGAYMAFQLIAPQLLLSSTHLDIRQVGYLISIAGLFTTIGMLASGWHSDRLGSRFGHLLGSLVMVAGCFALMAAAATPAMMIGAYFLMAFFWPAVTLSTNLVVTEVVPCRLVPVAVAGVNTLAQLGAFVAPILWGISKDSTGSYNMGLAMVPIAFIASAAVAANVRRQVHRNHRLVTPALEPV